jgi:hypothetical protein
MHTSLVQFGQELMELWTRCSSSVGVFLLFFDVLSVFLLFFEVLSKNADEVPMKVSIPICTIMYIALIKH